jgi:hypothetical protein
MNASLTRAQAQFDKRFDPISPVIDWLESIETEDARWLREAAARLNTPDPNPLPDGEK